MQNPNDLIEQIDKMRMGVNYSFCVKVRSWEVMFRPLTIKETLAVANKVSMRFSRLTQIEQNALTEHVFLAEETLQMASTSHEGASDYQLTGAVFERFTPDEVMHIHKQYLAGVDKVNPTLELLSAKEMDELVEGIKKKEKKDLVSALTQLSFSQLLSLTHSLLIKEV